ncbi:MAG: hypothetical protein K2K80_03280 [Clostridia bacterium]|nr:hypothetical protein [Clostridia bacterium]
MEKKSCKNCNLCKLAYRLFWYSFSKSYDYYCTENDEMTEAENVCYKWRQKEKQAVDLSAARFVEAEEDINIIKKLVFVNFINN